MARPRKSIVARIAPDAPPLAVDQPAFQARADIDAFDLHNGILEHLGFDRLTGSAVEQVMEARSLKGTARSEKLRRAIRYLELADKQAVVTALAMCVVLPAWVGVMLRCGGLI